MTTTRFPNHLRLLGPALALVPAHSPAVSLVPLRETGIASREALLDRLVTMGELAPRAPLSFLVVKVTGLGFSEGDDQLRIIGERVQELTRGTDMVGRVNETMFGIALQGTGVVAAGAVAARLTHHLNRLAELSPSICITVSAATGTGLNAETLPIAAMETYEPCCG